MTLAEGERLLYQLLKQSIDVQHECGGARACATCAVILCEGIETLAPADEDELDILERAGASHPQARLACQTISLGGAVVIEIPEAKTAQTAQAKRSFAVAARPIVLTERVAQHFSGQLAKLPAAIALRLSVEAAGCSGLAYRIDPASATREDDVIFESLGIRIVVDPASLLHVHGTTLDVAQDGLSRRLRFDNPNARQTCGCGATFGT